MTEPAPIADERRFPFFIVTTAATRKIREGLGDDDPGLSQVIAVYTALAEIANEARAGNAAEGATEPFSAARKRLSTYSGCRSTSTVRGATEALKRLGLLRIERRPIAGARDLPNRYILVGGVGSSGDPCQEMTPGVGSGDDGRVGSSGDPFSRKDHLQETPQVPPSKIEQVWDHYVATFNPRRVRLDEDERAVIRAALRVCDEDRRGVDELKTCIATCSRSDWHMKRGEFVNRPGKKHYSLVSILKPRKTKGQTQRSRIDMWLDLAAEFDAKGESAGWKSFLEKEAS